MGAEEPPNPFLRNRSAQPPPPQKGKDVRRGRGRQGAAKPKLAKGVPKPSRKKGSESKKKPEVELKRSQPRAPQVEGNERRPSRLRRSSEERPRLSTMGGRPGEMSRDDLLALARKGAKERNLKSAAGGAKMEPQGELQPAVTSRPNEQAGTAGVGTVPVNVFQRTARKKETDGAETTRTRRRTGRNNQRVRSTRRPPQVKEIKLNRQYYLEFKVEFRSILATSDVQEEHHANLLGSIWAKGERIGVKDARKFIDEKVQDGVMGADTGTSLKRILKKFATKR